MIIRLLFIYFFYVALGTHTSITIAQNGVFKDEMVYTDIKFALKNPLAVTHLSLSGQKLKKIPKEVAEFKNLRILDISKNRITEFPDFIGSLSKLEKIDAFRNKIEALPDTMHHLKQLKTLDLGKNDIFDLPRFLTGLTQLEQLNLTFNPIYTIPGYFSAMHNLRFLDLRNTDVEREYFEIIRSILPHTQIEFSEGCNCGPGN